MAKGKPVLKAECIRLRCEDRKSFREIQKLTGASKGSLSVWLRPYPLTEEEQSLRKQRPRARGLRKKDRGEESLLHQKYGQVAYTGQEKAKIAEAAVLFRLILHQLVPFGSAFDGDRTDWLVEVPETSKIHKIQVRWAKRGVHGLPYISLQCAEGHSSHRKFLTHELDFIVGYDFFTDTAYVWSEKELRHLNFTVTICAEAAEQWGKLRL